MNLKLRILRSFTRLFIILVSLTRSLFSEKMLISNRCISGLMSNLIKTSWADSILGAFLRYPFLRTLSWGPFHGGNFSYLFLYISRLEIIVKWHLRRIDLQVPLFTKFRPTMRIQGKMGICPTGKFNQEPNYFKKFEFSRQKRCGFFTLWTEYVRLKDLRFESFSSKLFV